jgi:hypothetical protein
MFITDHGSEFFHHGARVKKTRDPGSGSEIKNLIIFTEKIVTKLLEIRSGMFIPGPDFFHPGFRIRGAGIKTSTRYRIRIHKTGC